MANDSRSKALKEEMGEMFKNKLVRDRFDKKKGAKDRKGTRIGESSTHECNICSKTSKHTHFR